MVFSRGLVIGETWAVRILGNEEGGKGICELELGLFCISGHAVSMAAVLFPQESYR